MPPDCALPRGSDVLLLEDDGGLRRRLAAHLRSLGAEVTETTTLAEARNALRDLRFEFALVDLHLPDGDVLTLLREGAFSENTAVVVMTAFGGITQAVEAMRLGAIDYLSKPFEPAQAVLAFARGRSARSAARHDEHQRREASTDLDGLHFGDGLAALRRQLDTILNADRRLQTRLPAVLIEGETGTGKSAIARWLHDAGPRATGPFVTINCAALPDTLAESELFGHERGAFTDARKARIGLIEAAEGGTLFLDEIGLLSAPAQAKLLVALDNGLIRRLGGTREIPVDTRIVAATNRALLTLVQEKTFREDLYHRLDLLHLTLPPLRERASDIPTLARHLLNRLAKRHRLAGLSITAEGDARLRARPWPGNVRELAHELERAIIYDASPALSFSHLAPPPPPTGLATAPWRNPAWTLPESGFTLESVIDTLVADALAATQQNLSAAARRLGVTREFLRYRLAHPPARPSVEPTASTGG